MPSLPAFPFSRKFATMILALLPLLQGTALRAGTYMVDWDHANTALVITGQGTSSAVVTGNILETATGNDSGYEFTFTMDITDSDAAPPVFTAGDPSITTNGGQAGVLDIDIDGTNRNAGTLLFASFSVDGAFAFTDVTTEIVDIDRGTADAWIDLVEILWAGDGGPNNYTYSAADITQTGDVFVGDSNVPATSSAGNLTIESPGLVGNSLDFLYGPAPGDAFTSGNQRVSMASTMEFELVPTPEPSGLLLFIGGAACLFFRRRK